MYKLFLAAGVAALAMSAPSAAKPDGDRGGNRAKAEKSERGGDRAERRSERRNDRRVERRAERRNDRRAERRAERRDDRRAERRAEARAERRRDRVREERAERRNERVREARAERRAEARAERRRDRVREERAERRQDRIREARAERRVERRRDRRDDRIREARAERIERIRDRREELRERARDRRQDERRVFARLRDRDDERRRDWREWDRDDDRWLRRFAERGIPAGFINGCPPGLAKQNELCMPPGQYKKQFLGQRLARLDRAFALPLGLRDIYRDTDDYYWRYNDGYAYRVDRDDDLIRALLPLFGGGMTIGQRFPYGFNSPSYFMPSYYQPFYRDSRDDYYRYSNGYVYEIDRRTGLIEDIIPLYNQGYGIGQMLPTSYSYYNLPYQYRSFYADSPDYYYRYAPGAIYQVDRDTQLITAIASLLMGGNGLAVGQPLPLGYSAYNVPYGYRDLYYDTPNDWYRYANGSIYRVDPTTQLVTAVVSLLTGGLGIGNQFPYGLNSPSYYMPSYYQPFYRDSRDDYYRYANGYAYEIDRGSGLIEDVIPLYDRGFGVGQVLPASYSYYNVPMQYRDWYADDDDYYYRYAPGAIYQVDRDTRTISSIAALLSGSGLAVGQPLPVGYSVYNVPYAYRDRYYDTPDAWYRYSNGYIYQVDPQTRLITALIDAIV